MWSLPRRLECLLVSGNELKEISKSIRCLSNLSTLDISHNKISSLSALSSMHSLKFLYASYNKLKSMSDLESLPSLLEIDVEGNFIKEDITSLDSNSGLCIVNLKHNPGLRPLVFSTSMDFSATFTELEEGLFFRNPEKLRDCTSLHHKNLVKMFREHEKNLNSPDWACSLDEKQILEVTLMKETFVEAAREAREEVQPKEYLETLLEELIDYCHLNDLSPGNKYEEAINILKEREDERRRLLLVSERTAMTLNDLEGSLWKNRQDSLNTQRLKWKQLHKQLSHTRRIAEETQRDNHDLENTIAKLSAANQELRQEQSSLIQKIMELEKDNFSGEMSLRSEHSFYRRLDHSQAIVNKELADYIRKLLCKINRFSKKIKVLREQRDKLKLRSTNFT